MVFLTVYTNIIHGARFFFFPGAMPGHRKLSFLQLDIGFPAQFPIVSLHPIFLTHAIQKDQCCKKGIKRANVFGKFIAVSWCWSFLWFPAIKDAVAVKKTRDGQQWKRGEVLNLEWVKPTLITLIGGLEHEFYFPCHVWDVILPID